MAGWWDRLQEVLRGRDDPDAADRPDLRRRVVEGVLAWRRRGERGEDVLTPMVVVRIEVPEEALPAVRTFVDDRRFDADVEADLRNRLAPGSLLPVRRYRVVRGDRVHVEVQGDADEPLAWAVVWDSDVPAVPVALSAARTEVRMGRGPLHGSGVEPNDIVLSSETGRPFVSRRAAVLRREGGGLVVAVRDQGRCLVVRKADGREIRPYHTRRRQVAVEPGDRILFTDGGEQAVTVELLGALPEETA